MTTVCAQLLLIAHASSRREKSADRSESVESMRKLSGSQREDTDEDVPKGRKRKSKSKHKKKSDRKKSKSRHRDGEGRERRRSTKNNEQETSVAMKSSDEASSTDDDDEDAEVQCLHRFIHSRTIQRSVAGRISIPTRFPPRVAISLASFPLLDAAAYLGRSYLGLQLQRCSAAAFTCCRIFCCRCLFSFAHFSMPLVMRYQRLCSLLQNS